MIGGATVADRNVISGNDGTGVFLNGTGATNNDVLGNYIGLNAAGTATLRNFGHGVDVGGGSATGNTILSNLIAGNQSLGINLDDNAVTPNDAGDPDAARTTSRTTPFLTSAVRPAATSPFKARSTRPPRPNGFIVEFFASPGVRPFATARGSASSARSTSTRTPRARRVQPDAHHRDRRGRGADGDGHRPRRQHLRVLAVPTIVNAPQTFT